MNRSARACCSAPGGNSRCKSQEIRASARLSTSMRSPFGKRRRKATLAASPRTRVLIPATSSSTEEPITTSRSLAIAPPFASCAPLQFLSRSILPSPAAKPGNPPRLLRRHPHPPDDDAAVAAPDGDPMTGQHRSVEQAGRLSAADFRALYQRLRRQADWGPADRRGALNYITPGRLADQPIAIL